MNNIFKKGFYILAALVLGFATSCDDDDTEIDSISGLDFVIATLNLEGTEIGVVPTTVDSNNRILYVVDFGATQDDDTDNEETSGPMVTFEYPNEDGTYSITVTASLEGAASVSITKEVTITEYIAPTTPTGPGNPIAGTWRIAQELGSLAVGPGLLDGTGAPWWSADDEALADRTCLWDDEYVFNEDGTFENVLQGETWLEQIGDPGVSCYGVDTAGCGPTVFPYDGSASATYEYNADTESLTIEGKGAFLGLSKVINGGEVCPSDAADSLTYIAKLDGDVLEVFIQTDAGNDAYWYYKLVREGAQTIVGTWRIAQELGSLAVGPGLLDGTGAPWWSADDEALADRTCLWDDEYVFNEDGTFENVLQGETWLEQIGDPGVSCYGVDTAGCGPTVFPYDGSASATYEFNAATESLTIEGKGAFLGLSKVINGGEVCPSDAADSLTYIASFNDEGALEVFIQTDAANNAYWYFKLVKE